MEVSVGEFAGRLTQLLKAVEDGEHVTITRNGEPVADLVRTEIRSHEGPKFGTLAGLGIITDPDWHKGPQTNEEVAAWLDGQWE